MLYDFGYIKNHNFFCLFVSTRYHDSPMILNRHLNNIIQFTGVSDKMLIAAVQSILIIRMNYFKKLD